MIIFNLILIGEQYTPFQAPSVPTIDPIFSIFYQKHFLHLKC